MMANASRCNEEQKERLVAFVEKHPKLVKRKFSATFTAKDCTKLWEAIAQELNAIPGPSKKGKDWKETWRRMRRTTKDLQAKLNVSARKTGGGRPCTKVLRPLQERVLALLGKTSIEGHSHRESAIAGRNPPSQTAETSDSEIDNPCDLSEVESLHILDSRPSPLMNRSPLSSDQESESEQPARKKPSSPLQPLQPTVGPSKPVGEGRKRMRAAETRFVHAAAAAENFKEASGIQNALKKRELDMLAAQNEVSNRLAAEQLEDKRQLVGAIASVGRAIGRIVSVVEIHYGLLAEESQVGEEDEDQ